MRISGMRESFAFKSSPNADKKLYFYLSQETRLTFMQLYFGHLSNQSIQICSIYTQHKPGMNVSMLQTTSWHTDLNQLILYNNLDIWVSNIKKLVAIAPQQVMLKFEAYFLQQIKKIVLTFRNQFKNFKIVGLT